MRTRSAISVVATLVLLAMMIPGAVVASSPHTVDPDSVSPPLNPHYAPYDCWATGTGSICQGEVQSSFGPEVMDWFSCDGRTIYVSGSERQHITRWHLPDGGATKTVLHVSFPGDVFSLTPDGTGPTVTLKTSQMFHYEYLVPGVRDSRILRASGALLVVKASDGGGVLAHEVGWVEYAPGLENEEITDLRGPKDLLDDFDGFVERVCDHLLGR